MKGLIRCLIVILCGLIMQSCNIAVNETVQINSNGSGEYQIMLDLREFIDSSAIDLYRQSQDGKSYNQLKSEIIAELNEELNPASESEFSTLSKELKKLKGLSNLRKVAFDKANLTTGILFNFSHLDSLNKIFDVVNEELKSRSRQYNLDNNVITLKYQGLNTELLHLIEKENSKEDTKFTKFGSYTVQYIFKKRVKMVENNHIDALLTDSTYTIRISTFDFNLDSIKRLEPVLIYF